VRTYAHPARAGVGVTHRFSPSARRSRGDRVAIAWRSRSRIVSALSLKVVTVGV
jgi:hypothetical protein